MYGRFCVDTGMVCSGVRAASVSDCDVPGERSSSLSSSWRRRAGAARASVAARTARKRWTWSAMVKVCVDGEDRSGEKE